MTSNLPIVIQLQADAANSEIPVTTLLRKAKIIATKLEQTDILAWINNELNGYENCKVDDLPKYRQTNGELKAFNPYHGWQPIIFESVETRAKFSSAPIGQAIGPMEEMIRNKSNDNGSLAFDFHPQMKQTLINALEYPTDVQLLLNEGSVHGILDAVRNAILEWTLKLEKAGILGENLAFPSGDKEKANPVTQQFFAQNIGHVGNVYDNANVVNIQTAEIEIDQTKILTVLNEISRAVPLLPEDKQAKVKSDIETITSETQKPEKEQKKSVITGALQSIKNVCEGIAGNVAAQGIISLLSGLG